MILKSIKSMYKNTFNYKGVASLGDYWYPQLFLVVFYIVAMIMLNIFLLDIASHAYYSALLFLGGISRYMWALFVIWGIPQISLLVRRLRDIGLNVKGILLWTIGLFALQYVSTFLLLSGAIGNNTSFAFILNYSVTLFILFTLSRPTDKWLGKVKWICRPKLVDNQPEMM